MMTRRSRRREASISAQCPSCQNPLPVIVGKETTMRVAICEACGTEYLYSAWVIAQRNDKTFTKIELQQMGPTGVHVTQTKGVE